MKTLILLFFVVSSNLIFAQKDKCDKCFKKERKSKQQSSLFADENTLLTKPIVFYPDASRNLIVQFKKSNENKVFVCRQQTNTDAISFKRPFIIGNAIKIGIKFNNGQNYILTFEVNESSRLVGDYSISTNEKIIDEKLDELLKTALITEIEILNPFNDLNQNTVKTKILNPSQSRNVQFHYNCFLERKN
jgi:hypothetical protein